MNNLPVLNKVLIVVINFIVVLLFGTVFNHNKLKDRRSRIFGMMAVLMLVWVDFAYFARLVGENNTKIAEFCIRTAWFATPLLFYFTYLNSLNLLDFRKKMRKSSYVLLFFALFLGFLNLFSDLVISGIKFQGINLDIIYGVLFYPFLLGIFVFMVGTLFPLYKSRADRGVMAFLIGVLIFYFANLIFNIALPVFWGITYLYYVGDYSTLFLIGFTVYSIVRHELFDVRVISTEILTMIILSILFSKIFVANNRADQIVDLVVFITVIIFGYLLIRSIIREVEQREQLQELTDKLQRMDSLKNEFINMAAHELRAPLTAIKGFISMILDGDAGVITPKTQEFLEDSRLSSDRMIRLVNNMLDVSRIEEGRIVYQENHVGLVDVIKFAFAEFSLEARRKGLGYELKIADNIKDSVFLDKDRVHEVIVNFLSNAIKYTDRGYVEVRITNPTSKTIKVEVVDSGMGISGEEQDKLFRKFYRVQASAGKTIGTGLGLYISKLLIEKFGGKIGVESEFGQGSNFWFELPLEEDVEKRV